MRKIKIGVLGSTRGSSLQPVIDAIESRELNAEIKIVLSNKPDAGILDRARMHWIAATYVEPVVNESRQAYDEKLFHLLNQHQVDLVLLVGYMKILSKDFVNSYPRAIINIHPSLLPKHAGLINLAVHQSVLDAGEELSGCSVHFVDEGLDTGDIIIQKHCPVMPKDSAESLRSRVQLLEGGALIEAIELLQQQGFHYE